MRVGSAPAMYHARIGPVSTPACRLCKGQQELQIKNLTRISDNEALFEIDRIKMGYIRRRCIRFKDIRHIVRTGPGRGIFDIIVTGHVFGNHGNFPSSMSRQSQSCGQADDSRASSVLALPRTTGP